MKKPLLRTFFLSLVLTADAFFHTAAHAQVPSTAPPAGGAATGVAAILPVQQHVGGTPEQTKVIALAVGIAGFAAAAATGSTSANH